MQGIAMLSIQIDRAPQGGNFSAMNGKNNNKRKSNGYIYIYVFEVQLPNGTINNVVQPNRN